MALTEQDELQRRGINDIRMSAGVGVNELWLYYFSLTGNVDEFGVDAYLHGCLALPALDCDQLALALNEILDERGGTTARAPYTNSF